MRRLPNPWVAVPVLVAALSGGAVGYFVTDASCARGSCPLSASIVAAVVAVGAGVGIGVIAVLALKSLDEFRSHREREILVEESPKTLQPGPPRDRRDSLP